MTSPRPEDRAIKAVGYLFGILAFVMVFLFCLIVILVMWDGVLSVWSELG